MEIIDYLSLSLIAFGTLFFIASTIGLLRFPDVYCRLHALTKADNVGLGLICAGVALQTEGVGALIKLLLIWIMVIIASSSSCYLIARTALRMGIKPKVSR